MAPWSTFAQVCGSAAAGLTGLLFVAVSIRVDVLAGSAELRTRAAQTLWLFVTVLMVAIVLAIPGQAAGPLGGELAALGAVTGVALFVLDRRARRAGHTAEAEALARVLDAAAPNTVTAILLIVAGMLVAFGVRAGLDVLVAPVMLDLVGGVASAWLLLTTPDR